MPYSLKYMLIVYLRWLFVAKKLMWINLVVYSRKCSPLNSSGVDPTPPVVDPRVRYHPHAVGRSQILHCLESQQSLLRPAPQKVVTQALQLVWFKCTSEMTFGVDTMWRDALKWRLKRRCLHDVLKRCFKTMVRTGRMFPMWRFLGLALLLGTRYLPLLKCTCPQSEATNDLNRKKVL